MPDQIDLPKTIEGKAVRRLKYSRSFYWYIPVMSAAAVIFSAYAYGWAWPPVIGGMIGGLGLGAVLGVLLRDVP